MILPGEPRTKKNSQQILKNHKTGASFVAPSRNYKYYENCCLLFLRNCDGIPAEPISTPVNVKCLYYMPTKRRVDLLNLMEATMDILVHAGILADDNSSIVVGHDGSRVLYDKGNPRAEIYIEKVVCLCP